MAATYAGGVRAAWLQGTQAPIIKLPNITLKMLQDNIALDPANIVTSSQVVLRPSQVGGSAGSGGSGAAPPAKAADSWQEADTHFIRIHLVPRHSFFYPLDCLDGPSEESLEDVRVTHLVFSDGSRETQTHNWRNSHHAKRA